MLVTGVTALIGDGPQRSCHRDARCGALGFASSTRTCAVGCGGRIVRLRSSCRLSNDATSSRWRGRTGRAARLRGPARGLRTLAERCRAIGPSEVVIKRGPAGAAVLDADDHWTEHADPVDAGLDPVGAGDAFNAAYVHARLAGASSAQALPEGSGRLGVGRFVRGYHAVPGIDAGGPHEAPARRRSPPRRSPCPHRRSPGAPSSGPSLCMDGRCRCKHIARHRAALWPFEPHVRVLIVHRSIVANPSQSRIASAVVARAEGWASRDRRERRASRSPRSPDPAWGRESTAPNSWRAGMNPWCVVGADHGETSL